MTALREPRGRAAQLVALGVEDLDAVHAIEARASPDPWSRQNFADALAAGYWARGVRLGSVLLAYCVALAGGSEVHLLTLAVAPAARRQGWAAVLLQALRLWARAQGAEAVWLEVRAGNARARQIYARAGFQEVGRRKGYYCAPAGREDAILMTLPLAAVAGAASGEAEAGRAEVGRLGAGAHA